MTLNRTVCIAALGAAVGVSSAAAVDSLGQHHANPEGEHWTQVRFCDYASAGNLWRQDNYYRTWFPEKYHQFE